MKVLARVHDEALHCAHACISVMCVCVCVCVCVCMCVYVGQDVLCVLIGQSLSPIISFATGWCVCVCVCMQDKTCCVYSLDDPVPLSTFVGHTDVIRAVSYLPVINCYVTASWDK